MNAWNAMSNPGTVILHGHASERNIQIYTNPKNKDDRVLINASFFTQDGIKEKTMDSFMLLGCNTGGIENSQDYSRDLANKSKSNFASQAILSKHTFRDGVYGIDGTLCLYKNKKGGKIIKSGNGYMGKGIKLYSWNLNTNDVDITYFGKKFSGFGYSK